MQIFQLSLKVYILQNIARDYALESVASLIDKSFLANVELANFHHEVRFKNYVFNGLFPLEKETYKEGGIYTVVIRTPDIKILNHFKRFLPGVRTNSIQALSVDSKEFKIDYILGTHSITPAVAKFENGYWRGKYGLEEFETRIKNNAIKKYNNLNNEKLNENFEFIKSLKFINNGPISTKYKTIKVLGDKMEIEFETNESAQKLAKIIFSCGILEMNARGFGFVNVNFAGNK